MLISNLNRMLVLLVTGVIASGSALRADERAEELFVRRVKPLLNEKCFACHGADAAMIKGGLDLRSFAAMRRGGESSRAAVVSGRPNESPIYLAATRQHDDWSAMPPKEADKPTGSKANS